MRLCRHLRKDGLESSTGRYLINEQQAVAIYIGLSRFPNHGNFALQNHVFKDNLLLVFIIGRDLSRIDILCPLKEADSFPRGKGFLFQRVPPEWASARPGLTASPQADTASPAANTFFAALISRSWKLWHSGHSQNRVSRSRESSTCPQW